MVTPIRNQNPLPIQPVARPILCNPYAEPTEYWFYDQDTGEATRAPGRRPAGYYYKTTRVGSEQLSLFAEEQRDDLPLINRLREDVKRWRALSYEGATPVTKELLRWWWRDDRPRRLFFCQLEAVETVVYLAEIRRGGKKTRFTPAFTDEDLAKLMDLPLDGSLPLTRFGCKMATGSGKTVVMAMLVAWALCNRGRVPSDERFPSAALVVCPNLTVKERLQVLRPDDPGNYYEAFDIVPMTLRPELQKGKVLVTNWHALDDESPHVEGGKSYAVVDKGAESPDAFARRVLGDLYDRAPVMVLNDEGHHAYRPAPLEEKLQGEEGKAIQEDRQEATVWIQALDRINASCGIRFCVDLSATPFYIAGSGYPEGMPFPWLVSDFGLVDAIESGIVKIPRLPVSDTTGRPEPKYFRLWAHINERIGPSDRLPGKARRPKPEAVYMHAETALTTLAAQWRERFEYVNQAVPGQEQSPPVMIVVCDNTDIAEVFYRKISGETTVEVAAVDGQSDSDGKRRVRTKTAISYGRGIIPEFANTPDARRTLRIDSKLLAEAESEDPNASRQDAAQELRRIVATVGKPGEPGEQIRCVVSVGMLTEGWDANNVTHVLGVRAFGSQLLCEQVVGRGLRRMDYTPDPETGLLTEEYVDVYGIPFSVIPYKGRETEQKAPEDKPKNHVRALSERKDLYEIRFPVVEGYVFELRRNVIKADISKLGSLELDPNEPEAVFVKPQVGYQMGKQSGQGPGKYETQDREEYYASTHLQAIVFEIARQIVNILGGVDTTEGGRRGDPSLKLRSRAQLFPQVLRLVQAYVEKKVRFRDLDRRELGHQRYVTRIVERLVAAIEPDETQGEPPLLPILNRYKPIGTTAEVDFKTTKPCHATERSHVNQAPVDTATWEKSAAFRLEQVTDAVDCYVRNEGLGFQLPYQFEGVSHWYEPDYLVRLTDGRMLVLEVKGHEPEQDKAKHDAAMRWANAVTNWGGLGEWTFWVNKDPQMLGHELRHRLNRKGLQQSPQVAD